MAKRPSLYHQFLTSLRSQQRFGDSKHIEKNAKIREAHREGRSGFGIAPDGIFSISTYASYRRVAREYADWCKANTEARTMDEAKFYVGFYLQERIDRGLSAWTIQRDRAALRKIYLDTELAWEVEVPRRRLSEIKRSRHTVAMDRYFDPEKHKDIIDFAKATGLRRHELEAIRPKDIFWDGVKLMATVNQGKGGKKRIVTILLGMEQRVLQIIGGLPLDKPIFENIPAKMDIHSYRAEYATARLEVAPMEQVSLDLGHNRTDVIKSHYCRR